MMTFETGGARVRMAALVAATVLLAGSCSDSSDVGDAAPSTAPSAAESGSTTTTTTAGPVPGDDWEVSTPQAQGMDPEVLAGARAYAFAEGKNTQSVVVVRHGVIAAEWYAPGTDATSWVTSWSVGKSFASALVGIAIDQGKISGVDEPMTTWFPQWEGTDKAAMTLRDVLQMQSGLDWIESYTPSDGATSDIIQQAVGEGDQLDFAADQPMRAEPGTQWSYSSGDAMLLSGVIEQATAMSAGDYAQQELLAPIGIDAAQWWQDTSGHTLTYCCVDATSRDYARFGLLYLRGGAWGDDQIVPADWVADSQVGSDASDGAYGYQWWLDEPPGSIPEDHFAALGHNGQYIHVIPSLDLVVVRNGTYVKAPNEPVAAPSLFASIPSDGLVPGKGTVAPDTWSDDAFLGPVVASITDN